MNPSSSLTHSNEIPDDISNVHVNQLVIWCSRANFSLWYITLSFASPIRRMNYLQIVYVLSTDQGNPGGQYGYRHGLQAPPSSSTILFRSSPELHSVANACNVFTIPIVHGYRGVTVSNIVAIMKAAVPGHIPSLTMPRVNHGWISLVLDALCRAGYLPTDIF